MLSLLDMSDKMNSTPVKDPWRTFPIPLLAGAISPFIFHEKFGTIFLITRGSIINL